MNLGVPTLNRIEIHHDFAAHSGLTDQGCNRITERGSVLKHDQAKHLLETVVCKGELVNRGLGQLQAIAIGSVIAPVGIYGTGIIHAMQHAGGGALKNLTETTGATPHLQHRAIAKLVRIPAGFSVEALLAQIRARVHI